MARGTDRWPCTRRKITGEAFCGGFPVARGGGVLLVGRINARRHWLSVRVGLEYVTVVVAVS